MSLCLQCKTNTSLASWCSWHAALLFEFEKELIQRSKGLLKGLPTWNWIAESQAIHQSQMFSDRYLGGSELVNNLPGCIPNGPFKAYKKNGNSQCIKRGFDQQTGKSLRFTSRLPTADEVSAKLQGTGDYAQFHEYIMRNVHATFHVFVGGSAEDTNQSGDMALLQQAAYDVAFYFHHGLIEAKLREYTHVHKNAALGNLDQIQLEGLPSGSGVTAKQVLQMQEECVRYDFMGADSLRTPDNPPSSNAEGLGDLMQKPRPGDGLGRELPPSKSEQPGERSPLGLPANQPGNSEFEPPGAPRESQEKDPLLSNDRHAEIGFESFAKNREADSLGRMHARATARAPPTPARMDQFVSSALPPLTSFFQTVDPQQRISALELEGGIKQFLRKYFWEHWEPQPPRVPDFLHFPTFQQADQLMTQFFGNELHRPFSVWTEEFLIAHGIDPAGLEKTPPASSELSTILIVGITVGGIALLAVVAAVVRNRACRARRVVPTGLSKVM
jgi:hypothetical protein